MPYGRRYRRRRRQPKRRGRRRNKQMAFRTGQINAAGGRPVTPHSRTVRTVAAGHLLCTGTTAGDECSFNIVDWSAPADPDVTTFSIGGTAANRPSGHAEILADGYDRVKVLSSLYRFNVRFKGSEAAAKDFVFAYKFSDDGTAILTHTAGTVAIDNFKDLRQSRGWVWKRMSATHSGGSVHPSAHQYQVRIRNVGRLAWKMNPTTGGTDFTKHDLTHGLSTGANSADIDCFLHVLVMTVDGVALVAGDIQIDVDVFQKIRVWKAVADFDIERPIQEA